MKVEFCIVVVINRLFICIAYQNSEQKSIFQIPEQPEVIFQPPEQQHVIFQTPEQQEVIFQPEQDGVIFQNSRQKMIFENPKQDTNQHQAYRGHFASDGLKFAEQDADFIISCIGLNRICVNKKDCVNGYIHSSKSTTYSSSIKVNLFVLFQNSTTSYSMMQFI